MNYTVITITFFLGLVTSIITWKSMEGIINPNVIAQSSEMEAVWYPYSE